jgi:hypothetical protein
VTEITNPDTWLVAEYKAVAAYFPDSDCVEYVNEDTVAVYERIDEFLTIIWDETRYRTIGFKLKGFRYIFETHLKPHLQLSESAFVRLVQAIEAVCQELGDELHGDSKRDRAYRAARKIAEQDQAELWDLPLAA